MGGTGAGDAAGAIEAAWRAAEQGDHFALSRLADAMTELAAAAPDSPATRARIEALQVAARMARASAAGDAAAQWREFGLLQDVVGALPPDDPVRDRLSRAMEPAVVYRRFFDEDGSPRPGSGAGPDAAALDLLRGTHPVAHGMVEAAALLRMGEETDLARVEAGVAAMRRALASAPPGHPQHGYALVSVALALYRRSQVAGDTAGLAEAEDLLERAVAVFSGPQHPLWTLAHELLTMLRQRTGDGPGVSRSAVEAQRGYLWRVLLAPGVDDARASIRDAAADALGHARRSIEMGDVAGGLRALDAGRGLLLFAATEAHRIPDRLVAAGRADLAREWSQQVTPPDRLRGQVLDVLAGRATDDLFDPPALAQVQSALTLLGADALVYLVPGEPSWGGLAVMAPATGPPAWMALPGLSLAEGTEVDRYLAALTTRGAVDAGRDLSPEADGDFAGRVGALCDWAWRAAVGPLLESYLPRLPDLPEDRVPRIVLVPMGDLARVPWHAARRRDGVYAVQLAGISHAVSARLLCANAALAPVPLHSTGLVVGDPDTGQRAAPLPAARLEAHAIHRAFYRGGRYVGRFPDGRPSRSGAGTADDVRAWLTSRHGSAGAMLHLACHGYYAPGAGARLLLAGGGAGTPGQPRSDDLAVEELIDLLARVPDRDIALVVLAACNSGRSVYGYDEAYSLGTGFLAGGVRSVLSTQWSVPDAATSALMYLFHHHLRRRGLPAWQALREAQMWMLDPDRVPPPDMPAELVPGPDDDPAGVLGWAGFIHYGQ